MQNHSSNKNLGVRKYRQAKKRRKFNNKLRRRFFHFVSRNRDWKKSRANNYQE